MTYNPVTSCTLTLADGTQVQLQRSGLYPNVFAGRNGSVFEINELHQFIQSGSASVRTANRTTPVKYLVADAWLPDWEDNGETIAQIDDEDPFDVRAENLQPSPRRGRGRPRGGAVFQELQTVEVSRILGDIAAAAEELGEEELRIATLVMKWCPEAILDMYNVPPEITRTSKYKNLAKKYQR